LVLIVSPPGDLQIGLQALLTTHLDVDVLVVSEAASALKFIEKNNPDLVMLDQDISENTASKLVDDIKTSWPEIICVVLVNDDQVRQKIDAAGANLVIVKGLPGAKLVAETKKLLDMKGEK
jgi:DNA-binding NarL/FixJ family response regulator